MNTNIRISSAEKNRIRDFQFFAKQFTTGIGPNTLRVEYKKKDPEYDYPENLDSLERIIQLTEGVFINTITVGDLPIIYPIIDQCLDCSVLYPMIRTVGEKSPIYEIWPIYVSGNHSFFGRFSLSKTDMISRSIQERQCPEMEINHLSDIQMNCFYIYYCKKEKLFKRIRTEYWEKETDKIVCTLCDSGGTVHLKPLEIKELLPEVDPSINKNFPGYAVHCVVDMKYKVNRFPKSRRGLQICLTYADSQSKTVQHSMQPIKLQFLDYISESNIFVVRLFSGNRETNLFEAVTQMAPGLIEVDQFYSDNLNLGNFFASFPNPQKVASEMNIIID